MIKVQYQILQDEKDQVIDVFEREFENEDKMRTFEESRRGHPFLTLRAAKVTRDVESSLQHSE